MPSGALHRAAPPATALYRPRRPERSVTYQAVQQNLETWLAQARAPELDSEPIPPYVERDFRQYLACGILAHGFARARCAGCGHDFLIAFSCKGRGICPSCNTRRMAETAAHLVDHVFPQIPVRQWVLSLPKRLRYFLHHEADLVGRVLRIFLHAVEGQLKACSPGASPDARFGAVTFVHRFGAALNTNLHFHCAIIDGVFSPVEGAEAEGVRFHEATALMEEDIAAVQRAVRRRVLRLFKRRGLLEPEAAAAMRQWEHGGGFSLNAQVRIEARDRKGLERLLRYCARPIFAGERLVWAQPGQRLMYQLPKPRPDGQTVLSLTPMEFLERLAGLIPPPRRHRHRYHGVLAPNAPLRAAVTARAGLPMDDSADGVPRPVPVKRPEEERPRSPSAYLWAMLLARIYEVFPLICAQCGEPMMIIAFVTEGISIQRILRYIGEPTTPPPIAPCRVQPRPAAHQTGRMTSIKPRCTTRPLRSQHRTMSLIRPSAGNH